MVYSPTQIIANRLKIDQVLIICGPTATGKTKFGLELAREFSGEIVSADSRQVYVGKNLIYGKDLPQNLEPITSNLKWRDRYLKFYEIEGIQTWLYDVVEPKEEFSVALWLECAHIVIEDILSRQKLPIIVGGTGLYLKALTQNLTQVTIPRDEMLRKRLEGKSPEYLWNYLQQIRPAAMNESDRHNPRRLVRAIEIATAKQGHSKKDNPFEAKYQFLQVGLTTKKETLLKRVDRRVDERIAAGAAGEDPILSADPNRWKRQEHQIVRQQLTWFKKQLHVHWFDITSSSWKNRAERLVERWYNDSHAAKN